jgi:D-sedoheptulose 7-phosphate isomerase
LFSRQLAGLARPGDVFIALSTSGTSPNVVAALRTARELGVKTIGLTGMRQGAMSPLCDVLVAVPSASTPYIQQVHITVGHIICAGAEKAMFPAQAEAARERAGSTRATSSGA